MPSGHLVVKRMIKSNSKIRKQNVQITTSDLMNINPFYNSVQSNTVSPVGRH